MVYQLYQMNKWMNKMRLQEDSLQVQMKRQKSKRQYINYHKLNRYHQNKSPHRSNTKPNHINHAVSPVSLAQIGQIMTPVSAQKSLIIKNIHLEPSMSRQLMLKVISALPQNPLFSYDMTKNAPKQNTLIEEPKKHEKHYKQKQRRFRIKQSYRMKTEQITINLVDSWLNKSKLRRQRNSEDKIERISIQISKSIALNDLNSSCQGSKQKSGTQSQIQIKQHLLFENQSNFLKIHKISPTKQASKLYFTQNKQQQDSFDFQKVRKISVTNK